MRNLAWTAFLTQAGVSIGLAELVALRYPEMGARLGTLILAVIAINQLVGPVLFKWALRRVGEAGRADEAAPEGARRTPAVSVPAPSIPTPPA